MAFSLSPLTLHREVVAPRKHHVEDDKIILVIAGVLEQRKGWQPTPRGTPQGGVISPLLANLYLNPLDHQMAAAGWAMARSADDFVVLCRTQAEAQQSVDTERAWVSEAELSLHPDKTRVVDARVPGGFDFLGYHFGRGLKWPRKKSLEKLKERVRAKTSRLDGRSLSEIVTEVNFSRRGWHQYFQFSQANTVATVDGYVRRRLRSVLQWRLDGRGQGIGATHPRWPNAWLARRGLLSLAAEHAWTRTIVKLRTH